MATNPTHTEPEELDEETKKILDERLRRFDEDVKEARPAKEVLAEIRTKFTGKPAVPR